jgi:hypothetical protein
LFNWEKYVAIFYRFLLEKIFEFMLTQTSYDHFQDAF